MLKWSKPPSNFPPPTHFCNTAHFSTQLLSNKTLKNTSLYTKRTRMHVWISTQKNFIWVFISTKTRRATAQHKTFISAETSFESFSSFRRRKPRGENWTLLLLFFLLLWGFCLVLARTGGGNLSFRRNRRRTGTETLACDEGDSGPNDDEDGTVAQTTIIIRGDF